jgi:hypothetical protein
VPDEVPIYTLALLAPDGAAGIVTSRSSGLPSRTIVDSGLAVVSPPAAASQVYSTKYVKPGINLDCGSGDVDSDAVAVGLATPAVTDTAASTVGFARGGRIIGPLTLIDRRKTC